MPECQHSPAVQPAGEHEDQDHPRLEAPPGPQIVRGERLTVVYGGKHGKEGVQEITTGVPAFHWHGLGRKLGIHWATMTSAKSALTNSPRPAMNRLRASRPPSSPDQVDPVVFQQRHAKAPPTSARRRQPRCTRCTGSVSPEEHATGTSA